MSQGNVVLLNGTSSAGKSSIARALQAIMETPYLHTGVDHFLQGLPKWCSAISDGVDLAPADYFQLIYEGGAARTVAEREGGQTDYSSLGRFIEVRLGPGGVRLLAAMYRGIAAQAAAGVDIIVDDVIYDRRVLVAAVQALREVPVLFVGLRLPLAVAEQRERERDDRGPGGAAAFYHLVHAHGLYDLEVDTATASPLQCAQRIRQALLDGHPRRAFDELARQLAG